MRPQTSGKKRVGSQSDLPRFTYSATGSQADDAAFNAFAAKVKADLDSIFRDYDIEDKATLRSLWSARLNLQLAAGENRLALKSLAILLTFVLTKADGSGCVEILATEVASE